MNTKRIVGTGIAVLLFVSGLSWGLALSPLNGWLQETPVSFLLPITDGLPASARMLMATVSIAAVAGSAILLFLASRPVYRVPETEVRKKTGRRAKLAIGWLLVVIGNSLQIATWICFGYGLATEINLSGLNPREVLLLVILFGSPLACGKLLSNTGKEMVS
ncbi:MAG: hypothetical protein WC817_01825 [Patescibacteria group bacterium]|jgi:hypothetical protein